MADPTGNLILTVTTADGKTHRTTREESSGKWSRFEEITTLSAVKSTAVTGSISQIFATDSSSRRRVWSTYMFGSWQPAATVLTGVAPVASNQPASVYTALLAVGSTGLEYSLPLYILEAGKPLALRGDQFAVVGKGPLDLSDYPSELSLEGVFERSSHEYNLCMATESGGVFHVYVPRSGPTPSFIDLKAVCGNPGLVQSVGCSKAGEGLQVCVVNGSGAIHHAYFNEFSSRWTSFGTVTGPAGVRFRRLAVRGFNGFGFTNPILHMAAITDTGGLLHAIRQTSGAWLPFVDVKSQAGDPGDVTSLFADVYQYATP